MSSISQSLFSCCQGLERPFLLAGSTNPYESHQPADIAFFVLIKIVRKKKMTTNSKKLFGIAVLIIAIVSIDAQTFFTNGRYGKRSDLRLRGKYMIIIKVVNTETNLIFQYM